MTEDVSSVYLSHDKFFRKMMSDKRIAKEFFETHLPEDLKKAIDWNSFELQPRSFINEVRSESVVDILFKTRIGGKEAFLYILVEHQSTPDVLMPLRILQYTVNILAEYARNHKGKKLPLVYPLVVYHAPKAYPYSTDIKDLIDASRELIDQYFLKPFHLIDLGQIEDEELKGHAWVGVMEFALKHVFARDILHYVNEIKEILRAIDLAGGRNIIEIVLQYFLMRGELEDQAAFFKLIEQEISPEIGDKLMTLAERIKAQVREECIQQGIQKGIQQGVQKGMRQGVQREKEEVARRLLSEGTNLNFIAKITQLSLDEIKKLTDTH